ncbi:MAG: histidine kinase, partial [Pedobacter sp.]
YYGVAVSGFGGLLLNPKANKNTPSIWDKTFQKNTEHEFPSFARIIRGVRAKSVDYLPKNNQMALATNIGFYIVTPNEIHEIKNNNQSVYVETVIALNDHFYILDTKGNLYSVSQDFKFKKTNGTPKILDRTIRLIRKSNDDLLVVGADYIYILNTVSNTIQKIDFHLKAELINDIFKEHDEILILTNQDVIKVPINTIHTKKNSWFNINSVTVNQLKIEWNNPFKLSHDENNVEIKFSLLSYFQKKDLVFYSINNNGWIPIHKDSRIISFPSLSSGKYTIAFKVGNTVVLDTIQFEIEPPFWKTWWFYLLITFFTSVIIFLYFKRQSYLMRRQIRLLNEKVILEKNLSKSMMASIKSQMNPHFFYNALNTIQAYIFTNDKQKANNYLAKFSKLTRLILEMSEKETISLSEEVEALKLYLDLEKMRFTDDFEYEINLDKGREGHN